MTLALSAADTITGVAGSATSITYTISGDEITASGDEFKVLAQGQLPSSIGTIYTVPASTMAIVKSIHLSNPTGSAVTAKLAVNGTANSNVILPAISIVAGGFAVFGSDGWVFYNADGQRMGEGATGPQGGPGADGAPGANTITVEESDGTPSVADVDTVKFDSTGFTVTDNADGSVTVGNLGGGGGGGGVTQAFVGDNTMGASYETAANRIFFKKVTIAAACFLSSIDAVLKGNGSNIRGLAAGVYADNSNAPGLLIARSFGPGSSGVEETFMNTTARWLSQPCGIYLPAATYWLAVMLVNANGVISIAYDASVGTDKTSDPGGSWLADASLTTINSTTNRYSIRGNTFS